MTASPLLLDMSTRQLLGQLHFMRVDGLRLVMGTQVHRRLLAQDFCLGKHIITKRFIYIVLQNGQIWITENQDVLRSPLFDVLKNKLNDKEPIMDIDLIQPSENILTEDMIRRSWDPGFEPVP